MRRFAQVDVFTSRPGYGNPVAVVVDGEGLSDEQMARLARWTNLSETTFLLPATQPGADYRVRIFTPGGELPFAGHPTLGSCHAWLASGPAPRSPGRVVQECGVGLVELVAVEGGYAFAAPPLERSELSDEQLQTVVDALRIERDEVLRSAMLVNGPDWATIQLRTAAQVLALEPDLPRLGQLKLGVLGCYPSPGPGEPLLEVRAFVPGIGVPEDPVTGSLNAALAQWLIAEGVLPASYLASQGTVLGRSGRVQVRRDDAGRVWVGGACVTVVDGTVTI